ncbi:TPA: hypothetical protein ACJEU7_003039 [Acinetobacter baumannii]
MSKFTVITNESFLNFLNDSFLNIYLTEIRAAYSKINLLKLQSLAVGHVFNGQGVSLAHFHTEFFKQFLNSLEVGFEEACSFVSGFTEVDVEEYFEFLSDSGYANIIFEELNLDLNEEFSNFLELYNAYNAVMSFASSFEGFVLIPEDSFTEYAKDLALAYEFVKAEYTEYFDFEKLADNMKSTDYRFVKLNAPNTLCVTGDCYIRA